MTASFSPQASAVQVGPRVTALQACPVQEKDSSTFFFFFGCTPRSVGAPRPGIKAATYATAAAMLDP